MDFCVTCDVIQYHEDLHNPAIRLKLSVLSLKVEMHVINNAVSTLSNIWWYLVSMCHATETGSDRSFVLLILILLLSEWLEKSRLP